MNQYTTDVVNNFKTNKVSNLKKGVTKINELVGFNDNT